MTRNHSTDTLLRSLDAADHSVSAGTQRARTDLQRILSTDPAPVFEKSPTAAQEYSARRKSPAGRRVVFIGAVAVVAAGLVVLPSFSGGDPAFATWTAVPSGMTEQDRAKAVEGCRESQKRGANGMYAHDVEKAEPAIAERRGAWTTVILATSDGFSGMCITDDSANLFERGMIGSAGKSTAYSNPGPRELRATDLGTGTVDANSISLAAGFAGSDVTAVSYQSPSRGEVTATLSMGHFALWLPGDDLQNAASDGVEVEVTYHDGTVGTSTLSF
ncbi:hypothetical protein [Pseudarthrobacter sp. NamE5]|uniref:hypothetical protein n=1 Tax=Pseudarthrobacter sp. NamE5 TaxID=2576839 RepID=UPI00110B1011|nr:hypothetical protein [Pseudarthrobacter sp. NamE5]TLM80848.1 hypothetical protein FDW84_18560 [Pseudarthrobacter sp. NamE5]